MMVSKRVRYLFTLGQNAWGNVGPFEGMVLVQVREGAPDDEIKAEAHRVKGQHIDITGIEDL